MGEMKEEGFKYHLVNILQIVGFSVCGLIMVIVLNALFKPENYNSENVAGFYGEKEDTLDMVYIGGSAVFVYWQPLTAYENAGIASYNFASDTIQAELYGYIISETLKRQDPELFVIDARAFQYRDYNKAPDSVAYRNLLSFTPFSWEREQLIEEIVPKYLDDKEDKLSYHFDIGLYHTRYADWPYDMRFQIKALLGIYKNPRKGFWTTEVNTIEPLTRREFKTDEKTKLTEETEAILDKILAELKSSGKKALFVISQYNEAEEHKKIYNFVEEKVKQAGFDFLDVNEYGDLTKMDYKTDFYNSAHVNLNGSNKYTDFLTKYIKEKYALPDRRQDSRYSSWAELLDGWHDYKARVSKKIDEEKKGKE